MYFLYSLEKLGNWSTRKYFRLVTQTEAWDQRLIENVKMPVRHNNYFLIELTV